MQAYKFETTVSSDGTIHIPEATALFNQDVELIILPKTSKKVPTASARAFVEKWAGFLNDEDTDKSKYDYLMEKYK